MSDSVRPHRQQPTRLRHPWDSPGKNTGVGCRFLLQCMKVKSETEVAQSCLTLATPWTAAYQAPPSMGFSRQEYWSGVPLPSPLVEHSSTLSYIKPRMSRSKRVDRIETSKESETAISVTLQLALHLLLLMTLQLYHLPPLLPSPSRNSSCLFT